MKSLLLVAHGSRRVESNEEIAGIAASLKERLKSKYGAIEHAFLELAEPSIPSAIDQLASRGSSEIVILPYFLSAGRHVHVDVPEIVQAKQIEHPNIKILISAYLGESEKMIDMLVELSSDG